MLNAYCTSRLFLGVCLLQDDNAKMLPKVLEDIRRLSCGTRRCVSVSRTASPIDACNLRIFSNHFYKIILLIRSGGHVEDYIRVISGLYRGYIRLV